MISAGITEFLRSLDERLRIPYTPPNLAGGHDVTHVERLAARGRKIGTILKFDPDELAAAVWLHNLDRATLLGPEIKEAGGLANYCRTLLIDSPFNPEQRERIIDAVLQHPKKDDDPSDSPLLTALRIADKLDRIGPLGILSIPAFRGPNLLPYDSKQPFGYDSTVEGKLKSIYNDFFRVLEWYGMLPSDEARSLVNIQRLRFFAEFLRMLGEEIAELTGAENLVEKDIRKALGTYYHQVLSVETEPEVPRRTMENLVRIAVPPNSSDPRRDVYDLLHREEFPIAKHVNIIVFRERQPGKPWAVAQHWHGDGPERFRVAAGRIPKAIFEDIDTRERRVFENLTAGTIITIPPRVAHTFIPEPGLVLVGALRNGFNPNDFNKYPLADDDGKELPSPALAME